MWQISTDEEYKGHLISIYFYREGDNPTVYHEVRVREGNGLDHEGEWSESLYTMETESHAEAFALGKAFIDGMRYAEGQKL